MTQYRNLLVDHISLERTSKNHLAEFDSLIPTYQLHYLVGVVGFGLCSRWALSLCPVPSWDWNPVAAFL